MNSENLVQRPERLDSTTHRKNIGITRYTECRSKGPTIGVLGVVARIGYPAPSVCVTIVTYNSLA